MFIVDQDVVTITIHFKKIGKINYLAYGDNEFKEAVKDQEEQKKYKTVNITMKALTWGIFNDLQDISNIYDENSNRKIFNFKKYKEEKLKRLIVNWDATTTSNDGKQIPVPISDKNISSLAPSIAEAILEQYEGISILDDEAEKK